jgi:predicted Zn-dependent protease
VSIEAVVRAVTACPGVAAWVVREHRLASHQRYRIFQKREAERSARTTTVEVTVHTERREGDRKVLGESSFTLTGDTLDAAPALARRAVDQAALVANPPYVLPGPAAVPHMALRDPAVAERPLEVLDALEAELGEAAGDTPVGSSEFFAESHEVRVRTSAGFEGTYAATELYVEFALLAGRGAEGVECYGNRRARRPRELELGATIARHARWAADRRGATLPPTGVIPVVFSEEALDALFSPFAAHGSARARYEGWSRLTEGKGVVESPKGEVLDLSIDPHLPWRLGSRPFDAEGQVTAPVAMVRGGRFEARTASKRYADYLGLKPTGGGGNLVVAPGRTPMAELLADGPVLHALRFSTFHPSAVTGAFSGELRTAYLCEGGRATPVSGGSVSGNVFEAFADARLSAERTVRPEYDGPLGVRLEAVTVAGRP